MTGGRGSDPHGWRNALNYYGWGPAALVAGARVYDDLSYSSFDGAMKAAVRALVATGKPVGLLGWRGAHAQMVTGYYGLVGDPFARTPPAGTSTPSRSRGFYLTDPLRTSKAVNRARSYASLRPDHELSRCASSATTRPTAGSTTSTRPASASPRPSGTSASCWCCPSASVGDARTARPQPRPPRPPAPARAGVGAGRRRRSSTSSGCRRRRRCRPTSGCGRGSTVSTRSSSARRSRTGGRSGPR